MSVSHGWKMLQKHLSATVLGRIQDHVCPPQKWRPTKIASRARHVVVHEVSKKPWITTVAP